MTLCTHPGCDVELARNPRRKTTMCRRHATAAAMRRPEMRERAAQAMRDYRARPGYRQEHGAKVKVAMKALMRDPEKRKRYREAGQRVGREHGGDTYASPEHRSRVSREVWSRKLAHIPLEYREQYFDLKRRHHYSAEERAQIIADQIAADQRAFEKTGILPQTKRSTS